MTYDIAQIASICLSDRGVARAIEMATAALSRLDERVKRADTSLAEGFRERSHYNEAQSLVGLTGGFLHLVDLVLFDLSMNVQVPSDDMVRGRRLLVTRHQHAKMKPADLVGPDHLSALTGLPVEGPAVSPEEAPEDDELADAMSGIDMILKKQEKEGAIGSMSDIIASASSMPVIAGALLLLDHWRWHEGAKATEIGPMLASSWLRGHKLVTSHYPNIARGLRRSRTWDRHGPPALRLKTLADSVREAAELGMKDLDRMSLAREALLARVPDSARSASAHALIELFLALPLVTVEVAAKRLHLTAPAIENLLKRLGPALPRELTGRKRYRAWGVL